MNVVNSYYCMWSCSWFQPLSWGQVAKNNKRPHMDQYWLHCSGSFLRVSAPFLLWWELMDKASGPGKHLPLLSFTSAFNRSNFGPLLETGWCLSLCSIHLSSSSLSQWVHACDALELPAQQREQLDSFIDQLYKDIEKGHSFILVLQ